MVIFSNTFFFGLAASIVSQSVLCVRQLSFCLFTRTLVGLTFFLLLLSVWTDWMVSNWASVTAVSFFYFFISFHSFPLYLLFSSLLVLHNTLPCCSFPIWALCSQHPKCTYTHKLKWPEATKRNVVLGCWTVVLVWASVAVCKLFHFGPSLRPTNECNNDSCTLAFPSESQDYLRHGKIYDRAGHCALVQFPNLETGRQWAKPCQDIDTHTLAMASALLYFGLQSINWANCLPSSNGTP